MDSLALLLSFALRHLSALTTSSETRSIRANMTAVQVASKPRSRPGSISSHACRAFGARSLQTVGATGGLFGPNRNDNL